MEFEITKGNGKVKEFYANGKLLFEGEYVNEKDGMEKVIIQIMKQNLIQKEMEKLKNIILMVN